MCLKSDIYQNKPDMRREDLSHAFMVYAFFRDVPVCLVLLSDSFSFAAQSWKKSFKKKKKKRGYLVPGKKPVGNSNIVCVQDM